jgi:hypothetical protein
MDYPHVPTDLQPCHSGGAFSLARPDSEMPVDSICWSVLPGVAAAAA